MADNIVDKANVPPIKIAFIIDDEVVDILHTDSRLAAIFLSEPKIVDVTDSFEEGTPVEVGAAYNEDGTFTNPKKKD